MGDRDKDGRESSQPCAIWLTGAPRNRHVTRSTSRGGFSLAGNHSMEPIFGGSNLQQIYRFKGFVLSGVLFQLVVNIMTRGLVVGFFLKV